MSRRVAVLSPGGEFTHRLLALLEERGTPVDALVLYVPGVARYWRRLGSVPRRLLALPLLPARWAAWRLRLRRDPLLRRGAREVRFTGPLDGAAAARELRRLAPDAVVLARCSLIGPELREIPADGILNVHPGLLPWVRGSTPFANALLREVPLGCTAFRIDEGIDTGPVLRRRMVRVKGGETIETLRDGLFQLWVEMAADLAADAAAGRLPPATPQTTRFPLGRTLPDTAVPASAAATAKTLFDEWRPFADPADDSLPATFEGLPSAEETPR